MARIDGNAPKVATPSFKSLEKVADAAPSVPIAPPAIARPLFGLTGTSDLVGAKAKLTNLSGARGRAPIMDTPAKAELLAFLKEGMGNSGALPTSLQLKGGAEAKGETKVKPRSADEIAKSLAGKTREEAGTAMAELPPAEKKSLTDAIKGGKVTDGTIVAAHLTTLDIKGQVALLKTLPDAAINGVKEVWRKGELKGNAPLQTAVGIEMAARTPWGKDKANAGAIAALRAGVSEGKVRATLSSKSPAIAVAENGEIKFRKGLLENPEATAAILAHEGTHLHQGTNCCEGKGAASPQGETEGALAGIAVWDQLGKKDGSDGGGGRDTLNIQSERLKTGGTAAVKLKVLENYRAHAQGIIDEGKYDDATPGNTKADWEAKVKAFDAEIAKVKK